MSIAASLLAAYGKRPIWLAALTRGATVTRYRLGRGDIYYDGNTYTGSGLTFDELNYSQDIRKDDFTLENFALSDAATQALIAAGRSPLTIQLLQGFEGAAEFVVAYQGRLSNLKFGKRQVALVFSSWADDLSPRSPGAVAQRLCPWRLYGDECGVTQASFESSETASAYADAVVTVAGAAGEADGYYTGGLLTFGGEARTIEVHAGTSLTLSAGFPALADDITSAGSASVIIAAGCPKSPTVCRDRFSNIAAHGGFSAMTRDPFYESVF